MKEIERKFLLDKIPEDIEFVDSYEIVQFYLFTEDDKIVRVRKYGQKFNIGFKKGSGLSRLEKEIEISEQDFNDLVEFGAKNKISKQRHITYYGEYKIEVDEFKEKYEGLFYAEVEFENEKIANEFKPPKWFGKEVTGDFKHTNSYLSMQY